MTKEETLTQLRNAKKAHIAWVQRAHALIEGLSIEKEFIPLQCTDCKFGEPLANLNLKYFKNQHRFRKLS